MFCKSAVFLVCGLNFSLLSNFLCSKEALRLLDTVGGKENWSHSCIIPLQFLKILRNPTYQHLPERTEALNIH